MTPAELRARLLAEPDPGRRRRADAYAGRPVTWAGTAVKAVRLDSHLKVDLIDPDGLRVTGFCSDRVEPAPGAFVTIHGRLASATADGFVVEQCKLL
jgi:hypothetical protein